MGKTLYLHIGCPKTGSTSIQEVFYENREELRNQGFIYPGTEKHHHKLFFATECKVDDLPRHFKGMSEERLKTIIPHYFSSLEKDMKSDRDQIISTEYIFLSKMAYISNIVSYLSQFFTKIVVLAFIREPVSYFRSGQQQMVKGRSYIDSPFVYKFKIKDVIKTWSKAVDDCIVLRYESGVDSAKKLCRKIGVDYSKFQRSDQRSKASVSVEQMILFEKILRNFYSHIEDQLSGKLHIKTLMHINASFTTKPELQEWVKPVIYQNHLEDLQWLKEEYDIDFLNEELESQEVPSAPTFENGKARVRDVYKVPSEETVEKYEALVVDALLKKLVQSN